MQTSFLQRIQNQIKTFSALCVGLDPSSEVLAAWGKSDTVAGLRSFTESVLELLQQQVGFVKPQVAFYERFGSAGLKVLEDAILNARSQGLFVIADAKRGDIGSSMAGYASAWFGASSPLRSDALTVNSYMGISSLYATAEVADEAHGGLFALCATSNPEAEEVQRAMLDGVPLPEKVLGLSLDCPTKNIGLVIGATNNLIALGLERIRNEAVPLPILAPGFGAQGARLSDLQDIFGASSLNVIPTVSRSVLMSGGSGFLAEVLKAKAEL